MLRFRYIALLLLLHWTTPSLGKWTGRWRNPFQTKKYTPLVFFTVPRDQDPLNDEMEKVVSQVERDLDVHVERLDVFRNPIAAKVFYYLKTDERRMLPPLLYHRESCQYYPPPKERVFEVEGEVPKHENVRDTIDPKQVRAWAKGRLLLSKHVFTKGKSKPNKQEDNALDQHEALPAAKPLSPWQASGKQAMEERTQQMAQQN